MAKVPHSSEQHGKPGLIRSGNHFVVADRAARLDHRRRSGLDSRQQPIGEGKEGVRRDGRSDRMRLGPVIFFSRLTRLDGGNPGGVAAVHLSRADPRSRAVFGIDDRVRFDVARDAAEKAGWDEPRTMGSAVASDAFFPFADGLLAAVEAGATAVIQPGGSIRDEEVIAAADEAGLAMVFTGMRHFRH